MTTRVDHWRRRATIAESELEFQKENTRGWQEFVVNMTARQRVLSDRCTYLYGLAVKCGATADDLSMAWPPETDGPQP